MYHGATMRDTLVDGVSLAIEIERLLPALEREVGKVLGGLGDSRPKGWQQHARELRSGLQVLGAAIDRLEREPRPVSEFAPLWRTLATLGARRARASYEPIWRAIVRRAVAMTGSRGDYVRGEREIQIRCSNCPGPAVRFLPGAKFGGVRLTKEEADFVRPLLALSSSALPIYLGKHLRLGLDRYCPPCGLFYCGPCSPLREEHPVFSDAERVTATCPHGHERVVDPA